METTTLTIKGMTCMGCVSSVTRVLKATPGVTDAHVSLEPAQAKVDYDAALTNPDQLKAAVEDAGYEAS
jgi:copper chaperone